MKKFFTLLLLAMFALNGMAIVKCKARSFAQRTHYSDGWTEWSNWESSNDMIVMDGDKETINIYGSHEEKYDIITSNETYDDDGDEWINIDCVDDEGYRCKVQFMLPKVTDGDVQVYVRYEGVEWVWNVEVK
ncbi:MAG: hypothetical protein II144_03980 [Paludibacteraceae bacterium]|nr:hypothetical protein [Paludibacteraceae bacterium]MBQ2607877.1 hypothetical protein [Paludibacteraceae bacterium]